MIRAYRGSGSAAHHPRMLLGLLVYGYATGVFSSRKLERATYDSVRSVSSPPTIIQTMTRSRLSGGGFSRDRGAVRSGFATGARNGRPEMGTIGLDGTKIHANASRHSAYSYEHAGKIEAQLKAEVAELMAKAEAADAADIPTASRFPTNWRCARSVCANSPKRAPRSRRAAKELHARELAEHEAKLAARAAKTAATAGSPAQAAAASDRGATADDQINLTDEESRIMPVAGGGFDQCYNAQAAVAAGSLLVVAVDVVQAPNDKQQLEPDAGQNRRLPKELANPKRCSRHRIFQRGECRRLRESGDRSAD